MVLVLPRRAGAIERRQTLLESHATFAGADDEPVSADIDAAIDAAIAAALLLHRAGKMQQAELGYRQILHREPNHPVALNLLGTLQAECGRADIAIALIGKAIRLRPDVASFHTNLAVALSSLGRTEEAVASNRRALSLRPENPRAHSNLLVALHHLSGVDRTELFAELLCWGRQHADHLDEGVSRWINDPDPGRRIRVGYVSGELYRHPVGYFLAPVLRLHDASAFEIYCYSNGLRTDGLTEQLRASSDSWRVIADESDGDVADQIRNDRIDILVDLSWHLGNNRLLVFARKPAPVQVSWIAACNTTGMHAMDYLIADASVWPEDDHASTEEIVRLPNVYECYAPPEAFPEASALPARTNGYVTFGNFNRVPKMTPDVVRLWSDILRRVTNSRLVLKASGFADAGVQARFRQLFEQHGIASERLTFLGPSPHDILMRCYGGIDIALDPFPYSGCTTTAEALWMGVPVITLAGDRFVSRTSASFLSTAGHDSLVTANPEEYADVAVDLAGDLSRLDDLRQHLREDVQASPLGDAQQFTQHLESAYRQMWQQWCRARRVVGA
jgi:protein O-GlcNAc transferase